LFGSSTLGWYCNIAGQPIAWYGYRFRGKHDRPLSGAVAANGFAVEDATGVQLGVFYGRVDPNTAGHTGCLTMDDARQMAVDFAKLPKLLNGDRTK
jgi:hypothetical protein